AALDADANIRVDVGPTPAQSVTMDRAGLRRDYAAAFIYRDPVVKERQFLMADAAAAGIETRDRSFERWSDNIIEPLKRESCGETKAEAGTRARLKQGKFSACHDRVRLGTIGDAVRNRSYGIERLAQRKSALGRNALAAWLEADQPAQGGGNPH